jgi:hypothetical protein
MELDRLLPAVEVETRLVAGADLRSQLSAAVDAALTGRVERKSLRPKQVVWRWQQAAEADI